LTNRLAHKTTYDCALLYDTLIFLNGLNIYVCSPNVYLMNLIQAPHKKEQFHA